MNAEGLEAGQLEAASEYEFLRGASPENSKPR
jgi:hypothetical protein